MPRFIAERFIALVATLFAVSVVIFLMTFGAGMTALASSLSTSPTPTTPTTQSVPGGHYES